MARPSATPDLRGWTAPKPERSSTGSGDPYKPSALRGYRRDLEQRIIPALGPSKLADVKLGDLQRLAERWRMEGMSASSIRNAFLPLRAIYRYHAAVDGLTANPTRGLQLPAVRGRRDRIASPKEAAALLAALPEGERAVWGTAFYGGLRRGELRALPWEDVNLARGVIHVRAGWDDLEGLVGTKSRAGERVVPINARLRDLLVEHGLQTRRSTGLVFDRDAELPFSPGTVSKRAAKAWKKAKLSGVTLHEARHTFASLMIAAGANAKQVQAYMGHASIAITYDLYGHLLPGDEAHAAALLDAYLDEHEE